jgi:hypothetical protein
MLWDHSHDSLRCLRFIYTCSSSPQGEHPLSELQRFIFSRKPTVLCAYVSSRIQGAKVPHLLSIIISVLSFSYDYLPSFLNLFSEPAHRQSRNSKLLIGA